MLPSSSSPRLCHAALGLLLTASFVSAACKKEEPGAPRPTAQQHQERAAEQGRAASQAWAARRAQGADADALALPYDLGKVAVPAENPLSPEKIALGQQLFFDKRLSADGSLACYDCHQNEHGNGGGDPLAVGARKQRLPRHSPVIWNVAYAHKLGWDGRFGTLEEQTRAAWASFMAAGEDKLEQKAKELGKLPGYQPAFAAVFSAKGATAETVVQALAAYQRTLVCDDTLYDRYAKGEKTLLSPEQKRGLSTFMGKGGCSACHAPPFFSTAFMTPEGVFFNTGAGTQGKPEKEADAGRMAVTKSENDWAAFKPPSLRNVTKSAPYLHDGSIATLKEAVRFMAAGGAKNKNLTPLLSDRKLTEAELDEIVAFLGALACEKPLEAPKLP